MKALFKKLIAHFDNTTGIDLSRRRVIKGAVALATLAAIGANVSLDHHIASFDEFNKMVATGVIENMTFYVDRTLYITEVNGLIIRNCRFIVLDDFEGKHVIEFGKCIDCIISDCTFDTTSTHKVTL